MKSLAVLNMDKEVWRLAFPMILSNISIPLVGLVDTAVIGHLEHAHYLGGVAIGASLITFIAWIMGFLKMGVSGLNAQAFGRQDKSAIIRLLLQGLMLALVIGITLVAFQGPVLRAGLVMLDGSDLVNAGATEYFQIRIWSVPMMLGVIAMVGWLIGMQNTKAILYVLVTTNLTNAVLDWIFVVELEWGIAGAAWASFYGDLLGFVLAVVFVLLELRRHAIKIFVPDLHPARDLKKMMLVNRDIFIRTLALEAVFILFTRTGAQQGDVILAANAVLLNFLLIMANGLDGFANAAEALVGRFLGERKLDRFYQAIRSSGKWACLVSIGFALCFWLFGNSIIALLTDIEAVRTEAAQYLPYLALLPLLAVWSYLLDGIFIGAARAKDMRNTMLLSLVVFVVLLWSLGGLANHGLWLAFYGFMLFRGASLFAVAIKNSRTGAWLTLS